jgi:putative RNA 2'-phosphotransferase
MTDKERTHIGKFMSLVLRHEPQAIGAKLDVDGWLPLETLVNGMQKTYPSITVQNIVEIVESSDKKRFQFSESRSHIRAVQGHSVAIEGSTVQLAEAPEYLYHGTAISKVVTIQSEGLKPMSRIHVHLSADRETAIIVGRRHGKPAVFQVNSAVAKSDGVQFFLAENGVWLCNSLPPKYLTLLPCIGT